MSATLVEQLMDSLIENRARLRKLTLVNAHHSDHSFEKVIDYVKESVLLKDLDLSWSGVRPAQMLKLLKVIQHDRFLVNLSLANNELLEDQKTELTTQ